MCSVKPLKSRPLEVVEDKYSVEGREKHDAVYLVRSSLNPAGFGGPTFIDYDTEIGMQGEFRLLDAMPYLGAKCIHGCDGRFRVSHGPCCSYRTAEPPYKVLNSLKKHGYKVVAANSAADDSQNYQPYRIQPVWQIWTLHKQA